MNYPSAVSVFDIVPSRVSGKVITDALSSPTLTYTTDSSGYNSSTGTVRSTGVINNVFNQSLVDVQSALNSSNISSPIVFVLTGKWGGGIEGYSFSMGYGDWSGGVGDSIYINKANVSSSSPVAIEGSCVVDGVVKKALASNPSSYDVTQGYNLWYSHLVLFDPVAGGGQSEITFMTISEYNPVINTVTANGTTPTVPFTISESSNMLTYHKCDVAFMGMFYPDVLPTTEEAERILIYHFQNHTDKKKYIHQWFYNRARYT